MGPSLNSLPSCHRGQFRLSVLGLAVGSGGYHHGREHPPSAPPNTESTHAFPVTESAEISSANVILGETYPHPLVDHAEAQ
jgi:hypothetical protein